MLELRFHSRGGQGGVVAGKLLAVAVFKEGRYVQAFPTFGVERRAAPVMAFVRIDDKPGVGTTRRDPVQIRERFMHGLGVREPL